MPLFTADIEKRIASEFWTNRYIVQADDLTAAKAVAGSITLAERGFHHNTVQFTRHRVATLAPGDEVYAITPINETGARENVGDLLPLFNTLRFELEAESGRPSRKYYRGVLGEVDISGNAIVTDFSTFATTIQANAALTALVQGIVDPQGQLIVGTTVHPFVQMRQLRRSRRRRTNGGGIFQ